MYVPNAFTPNGDGLNDIFKAEISGAEINRYEIRVWNRRGAAVFRSDNPAEG